MCSTLTAPSIALDARTLTVSIALWPVKKPPQKLEELGLLIRVEEYDNNVGFSERAHVPVEPRISMQWFLKYPCVKEDRGCRCRVVRSLPSGTLGEDTCQLDGEYSGLVY